MGKYQGYEKYKASGVEWLGEIPEHWNSISISRLASKITNGYVGPTRDILVESGIRYIQSLHIKDGKILFERGHYFVTKEWSEQHQKSKLKLGDILIVQTGDIGQTSVVTEEYENCNCHALIIITPIKEKINGSFLELFLRSQIGQYFLKCYQTGALHPHLNGTQIKDIKITLPPLEEQEKIARFLDYKTKQIDELIAKKEALIEKLDEKRTALISHAVTKGLDPSVPMKDSGIEWLGEIPQHWKVIKVKYLTKILRGKFTHRPRNDPKLYDGQYPFIQTGDVANANKLIMEYTQTLNENGYAVSKEFPSGTLVMTIAANIGDMAILNFNACFPDSIVGFVPSDNTEIFFLYYLFSSMKKQFLSTAVLNTQLNLNVERISNICTVIPPLDEQVKITNFLDKEMQKADQQKAKIQKAIALLKEYRTALITNAVTGKIDVRQVPIP
jgi:type I restriction enzyme S subunit